MSHFLTLVLVGAGEPDVARRVDELLGPYFHPDGYGSPDPNTKCDGYVIGGRFDGQIYGAPPEYNLTPREFQKRYGLNVIRDADNIRPAREVPVTLTPYAVVTPAGRWHDREGTNDADWLQKVTRLLRAEHPDSLAVAVDCHC